MCNEYRTMEVINSFYGKTHTVKEIIIEVKEDEDKKVE